MVDNRIHAACRSTHFAILRLLGFMSAGRHVTAGDSLDFNPAGVFFCLRQVIFHLHAKPYLRTRAERLQKPDRHFRRDPGLLVHEIVQSLASHSEPRGCLFDCQP
jgi:hypothetical protein